MKQGYIMSKQFVFCDGERSIFTRRPRLSCSEWAARNIIVQDGPYKGSPMRLEVSPYLIFPMDCFSDITIKQIAFCGSLQIGKTLLLYACMCYAMDYSPGEMMLAMPNDGAIEKVRDKKLAPLIKGSPALKRLVQKFRSDKIELKSGVDITFASAESDAARASITIEKLFMDEEDLYLPGNTKKRPVDDFIGRTQSFDWRAKIVRVCQPKSDSSSIFGAVTREADQLYCFETKCPACHAVFLPDVTHIVTVGQESDPGVIRRGRLGRYKCPSCGYLWSDHIRNMAVSSGRWHPYRYTEERGFERAALVENAEFIGFHAPAVLSRQVSLSHIAARTIEVEKSDDEAEKRQYHFDVLAIPYSPVEVKPDSARIKERGTPGLPRGVVPDGAIAITLGVDTQKYGFWFLSRAFMPDLSSYIIDHGRLEDWPDVYRLAHETYYPMQAAGGGLEPDGSPRLSGEVLPFWRGALDTGGTDTEGVYTRTEEAYMFIREYGHGILHATKGASRELSSAVMPSVKDRLPRSRKPIPGGLTLYLLDTVRLKALAMRRLLNDDARYPIYLYENPEDELIEQLCSEKMVKTKNGHKWEKIKGENHYLDCLMLTQACADPTWQVSLPLYLMHLKQQQDALARAEYSPQPRKRRERSPRSRI